jgi:hypothetical protein
VTQTVREAPAVDAPARTELNRPLSQLHLGLAPAPPRNRGQVQTIALAAADLVRLATESAPDATIAKHIVHYLTGGAKDLVAVSPGVPDMLAQLIALVKNTTGRP